MLDLNALPLRERQPPGGGVVRAFHQRDQRRRLLRQHVVHRDATDLFLNAGDPLQLVVEAVAELAHDHAVRRDVRIDRAHHRFALVRRPGMARRAGGVGRADQDDHVLGDGQRMVDGGLVAEMEGFEAADDDGEVVGLHVRSGPPDALRR